MQLINRVRALVRDVSGQDLIEYGLLAALIAVGTVAAITASGSSVNELWTVVETMITGVAATV